VAQRYASSGRTILEYAGVTLDRYRHRAFFEGRELRLTLAEFRLLERLLERPGHTYSRRYLADFVRSVGHRYPVKKNDPRIIDQHVKELRRKLNRPELIETVWGVGYQLTLTPSARADSPATRVMPRQPEAKTQGQLPPESLIFEE
jgi:DNA-binding response OmpR family regulator